jgi:hypothetical protein
MKYNVDRFLNALLQIKIDCVDLHLTYSPIFFSRYHGRRRNKIREKNTKKKRKNNEKKMEINMHKKNTKNTKNVKKMEINMYNKKMKIKIM